MKYKISGTNRDTNARVVMEVEAQNRAAAERQAQQANMEVMHVEEVREADYLSGAGEPRVTHRGEFEEEPSRAKWVVLAFVLVAAAVLVYVIWIKR